VLSVSWNWLKFLKGTPKILELKNFDLNFVISRIFPNNFSTEFQTEVLWKLQSARWQYNLQFSGSNGRMPIAGYLPKYLPKATLVH